MAAKPDDKARAEAAFLKKGQELRERDKARADYESAARAVEKSTARLKALRLAKEAADRAAGIEAAPMSKPRPNPVRNPRSNLR